MITIDPQKTFLKRQCKLLRFITLLTAAASFCAILLVSTSANISLFTMATPKHPQEPLPISNPQHNPSTTIVQMNNRESLVTPGGDGAISNDNAGKHEMEEKELRYEARKVRNQRRYYQKYAFFC
jgi:hypothetical protein